MNIQMIANNEKTNANDLNPGIGDNNENENTPEEIVIKDFYRNYTFFLICLAGLISCADGGIIPQQNKHLEKNFNDDQKNVGLFSSIDYIGRIAGSIIMSVLINKMDRKIYFSGCCFFKGITLIMPLF